jgi:hypothetical protein
MSDSLGFALAIVFGEAVPAGIFLYAAYWALAIRRALAGPIYRVHALWLGILGIMVASLMFIKYSGNAIQLSAVGIYTSVLFAVTFAFVDSTVMVARRSDPLLRSVLRWEGLRIALWATFIPLVLVNAIPILSPSFANSPAGYFLVNDLWYVLTLVVFFLAAVALVIGARRSRDPLLRASLKWLGLFLSLFVVRILVAAVETAVLGVSLSDASYSYPALPTAAIVILGAYCLYKSARSLAPISPLPSIEAETISSSDTAGTWGGSCQIRRRVESTFPTRLGESPSGPAIQLVQSVAAGTSVPPKV